MIRAIILSLLLIFTIINTVNTQSRISWKANLSAYGQELNNSKKYDSAIIVFSKSIIQRKAQKNLDSLAFDQFNLGAAYYGAGKLDESIASYLETERILDNQKDSSSLRGKTYLNLGYAYKKRADYTNSLKYLFLAVNVIPDKTKDKASAYNALGALFNKNIEYDRSLEYFQESYAIYSFLGYDKGAAKALSNQASVYTKLEDFDKAKELQKKVLQLKRLEEDSLSYSTTLQNIGWTFIEMNQLDSAEVYLLQAKEIKEIKKDSLNLANNYNQLGELYLIRRQFETSLYYLKKALFLARDNGILDKERETLLNLAKYYRIQQDYKQQANYLLEYILVDDQVLNEAKIKEIQNLDLDHQLAKISFLEKKGNIQENTIKEQGDLLFYAICGILLLSFLIGSLIYFYISLRKSKRQIETLKDEMQHRIKNHLQQLSSIIKLQTKSLKDETAREALKAGENRVNAMNIIHQMLYEDKGNSKIRIDDYIKELCDNLAYSYQSENKEIIIHNELDNVEVDADKTISIGLIINELVTNAIKYAENSHAKISIHSKIINDDNLFLQVSDNGKGLPEDYNKKTSGSFGLNLVKILTKQLKAQPNTFNRDGAVFQFSIPLQR